MDFGRKPQNAPVQNFRPIEAYIPWVISMKFTELLYSLF